ncbi:hypothetical protein NPIL_571491, partial [Nephila pilipes]
MWPEWSSLEGAMKRGELAGWRTRKIRRDKVKELRSCEREQLHI